MRDVISCLVAFLYGFVEVASGAALYAGIGGPSSERPRAPSVGSLTTRLEEAAAAGAGSTELSALISAHCNEFHRVAKADMRRLWWRSASRVTGQMVAVAAALTLIAMCVLDARHAKMASAAFATITLSSVAAWGQLNSRKASLCKPDRPG